MASRSDKKSYSWVCITCNEDGIAEGADCEAAEAGCHAQHEDVSPECDGYPMTFDLDDVAQYAMVPPATQAEAAEDGKAKV